MKIVHTFFSFALLLLAACSASSELKQDSAPMDAVEGMETAFFASNDGASGALFVDPATVKEERMRFQETLKAWGRTTGGKRSLYQQHIGIIGANGVLDGIEALWPKCHSEAHDLGKIIYAGVRDIGTALRVCRDGCYSGCMHGVLMEAFAGARDADDPEGHIDVTVVKEMMDDICSDNTTMTSAYSPGDCAHATGHALMVLADYDVAEAVGWCDAFDGTHMRYYCATGAYMEYVTEHDGDDVKAKKNTLYPCDTNRYPAACMRYKMVHVVARLIRKKTDVPKMAKACHALGDPFRLGCMHGMGNGFMGLIASGKIALSAVCTGEADEQAACIDGAMERMAKYHPERAQEVCGSLKGDSVNRRICEQATERGMYDMKKDLTPYL
ncbi:hypothetical protein HZA45_00245 [Candidatus Peregrinibacteria bacterium]|nr:hypothetical protein [Candidatus Peregrinibacteria bacterium]